MSARAVWVGRGVTIFGALQAHASTMDYSIQGRGAQDTYARLCIVSWRPARPCGRQWQIEREGAGDRLIVSARDARSKALVMLVMNLFGAEVVEL
jgi:hypothetical protein